MLYIHNKELLSLYHERKDRHGRVRELFVWGIGPSCPGAGLVYFFEEKKKKERERERERERAKKGRRRGEERGRSAKHREQTAELYAIHP
jgi:hypothetical protein